MNFIRKNPVRFKVPLPVLEDPELVEVLAGLVSVYLTDLCSAIKQKVACFPFLAHARYLLRHR